MERNVFIVCIHDAEPRFSGQIRHIIKKLQPLIGQNLSVAAIPLPSGNFWTDEDASFIRHLKEFSGEILLHGYTHRHPTKGGLWSWFVEGADEFSGLSCDEVIGRLHLAFAEFRRIFDREPLGFVAPAWADGPILNSHLPAVGLKYLMGLMNLRSVYEQDVPLATYSWDCGRVAPAGWLGECLGVILAVRRYAVPVIVLHPVDVSRGYLSRALKRIRQLQGMGYTPILPSELGISQFSGEEVVH